MHYNTRVNDNIMDYCVQKMPNNLMMNRMRKHHEFDNINNNSIKCLLLEQNEKGIKQLSKFSERINYTGMYVYTLKTRLKKKYL